MDEQNRAREITEEGDLIMNLTGFSAGLNFAAQKLALNWAKENLPEERYRTILRSYKMTFKRTLIFVVACCLPIMIAFSLLVFSGPFSKRAEAEAMPANASNCISAHVDYDGNFYWTYDSKMYEYPLAKYGLSPEDYEFGDEVNVYVDDGQNVVKVTEIEKGMSVREKEVLVGVVGAILVPALLILCVYMPIARRSFARPWMDFCREFNG